LEKGFRKDDMKITKHTKRYSSVEKFIESNLKDASGSIKSVDLSILKQ
jgi:hypothetical protein